MLRLSLLLLPVLLPATPRAQGAGDGYVQFASRESEQAEPPTLVLHLAEGEPLRCEAVADTPLIAYLADRSFPGLAVLAAGVRDQCQVLLRFHLPRELEAGALRKAELVLRCVASPRPPDKACTLTLQRVTQAWREDASWSRRPAVAEPIEAEARWTPETKQLRFEVTAVAKAWLTEPKTAHGLLLRLPGGGPLADPDDVESRLLASLGLAKDAAEACGRAGRQGKLVLTLVVGSYGGKRLPADVQALLATAFQSPDLRALCARRFVPVLQIVRPTEFTQAGLPRRAAAADPLAAFGARIAEVKPPAVLVVTPGGEAIDRLTSIGTYDAALLRAFLVRAANRGLALSPDPEAGLDELLERGLYDAAAQRIAALPAAERTLWAARLAWLRDEPARVRTLLGELPEAQRDLPELRLLLLRAAMRLGDLDIARELCAGTDGREGRPAQESAAAGALPAPEIAYRKAWLQWRAGRRDEALALWGRLAKADGEPGWGLRAAARLAWPERMAWADGFVAPFVALGEGQGTECAVAPGEREALVAHALARLCRWQTDDGSWPIEVADYRSAVSAFAAKALLLWRDRVGAEQRRDIDTALERADPYFDEVLCAEPLEASTFGQTYLLDYLLARHAAAVGDEARARAAARVRAGLRFLLAGQCPNGAWSYSKGFGTRWRGGFGGWPKTTRGRAHSINTGPALIMLQEAKARGFDVDAEALKRGLDVLEDMRFGAGAYTYTHPDPVSFEKTEQSIARGPVCEQALEQGGRVPAEALAKALATFLELREGLRRPVKLDESWASPPGYSSYFFHFAYYHAALALRRLATHKDHRKQAIEGLAALGADLVAVVERDGSWLDYPQLGKPYGTAAALCVLAEVARGGR